MKCYRDVEELETELVAQEQQGILPVIYPSWTVPNWVPFSPDVAQWIMFSDFESFRNKPVPTTTWIKFPQDWITDPRIVLRWIVMRCWVDEAEIELEFPYYWDEIEPYSINRHGC